MTRAFRERPAAVITDLSLPAMDGATIAASLRLAPGRRPQVILLCDGEATAEFPAASHSRSRHLFRTPQVQLSPDAKFPLYWLGLLHYEHGESDEPRVRVGPRDHEADPHMTATPLHQALCGRALAGATGALNWTDGKRRRVFFFASGQLALVQSNLRSESPETLSELDPTLVGAALVTAVGRARVLGALKEPGGELRWMPDATAPKAEPVDLGAVVYEAGTRRPGISSWPKLAGAAGSWLSRQDMPHELQAYLADLDGSRTLDELLSYAPGGPEAAERWIQIAFTMGAIIDTGIESSPYEVRNVKKQGASPGPAAGSVDDIASLISDGLGQERPATPVASPIDATSVRFGPALPRIRNALNFFAVLGVQWDDPTESMRRAYITLARDLHPDRYARDSAEIQAVAAELFDKIRAAWETLNDDAKREAYIKRVIHGEKTEDELAMEKVRAILDAEEDFKRALNDFHAGRLSSAHELFLKVSAAVPEEAEFAAYAGYTTFRIHHNKDLARADAGAQQVRDALERNERLDSAWVLLGLTQAARGDTTSARESYVKALRLKPSNPDAVREMKRLERDKGQGEPAGGGLFNKLFGKK
ncbi:MAG: hypothetical protein EXR71_06130 [Myxococcales bacterium]|nr:hypothetical protein [Myxococcales bacterium]